MKSKWLGVCGAFLSLVLVGCDPAPEQDENGSSPAIEQSDVPTGRLPGQVIPIAYELDLKLLPEQPNLEGQVTIRVAIKQETDHIWLHGKSLEVSDVYLVKADGSKLSGSYQQLDATGVARVAFPELLAMGEAELVIAYQAPYSESLEAIYRVKEADQAYLFSQMEPSSARLAFPGFDEPAYKTPFDIQLTVHQHHSAVSNTPLVNEEALAGGLKRLTFATSKPLPTYLLAFAVGDLDIVDWTPIPASELRSEPIPLRGVTVKGKGAKIEHALSNTAGILATQEAYFGSPYPYAKLDIIAAPDFAFGAMENAGAIVYREQYVLMEKNAPLSQLRNYASIHAHELAHQWFGNLVTPVWWNDIWLNESFATWMASKTVNLWNPDLKFDRDLLHSTLYAMRLDALASARQIRQPIESNHDIATAFDGITYLKGGGMLSMFESYLGEAKFQEGVALHMERFPFGNADAVDFIQSMSQVSGDQQLQAAFMSFLEQGGLPTLAVDWRCDAGELELEIQQSRYRPLGSEADSSPQWKIPACFALLGEEKEQQHCALVSDKAQKVRIAVNSCPSALMPNANGAGYYNWSLNQAGWQVLLAQFASLNAKEQLSLIENLSASVRSGALSLDQYLAAVPQFIAAPDWDVVTAPMKDLRFIQDFLVLPEQKTLFEQLLQRFYHSKMDQLGLTATTAFDKNSPIEADLLRTELVEFSALRAQEPKLRAALRALAEQYIGYEGDAKIQPEVIEPDLVSTALTVALEELGQPYYEALLKVLQQSTDSILRENIVDAFGRISSPDLVPILQALILEEQLRDNEAVSLYFGLARSPANNALTWQWTQNNLDALKARLPIWRQGDIPRGAGSFCDAESAAKLEAYFAPIVESLEGGPRALAQALEQIQLCVALRTEHEHTLKALLTKGDS